MSRVKCQVPFSTGKREKAKKKTSKQLYVISSKRWSIQTDYPMGMPVMKGGSSQICVLVWTRKTKTMWKEKRKEGYSPDIKLPTNFQELLNGNFGDMCSFLYALHPVISSKKWNILTDYPMGMPVMKGGSSHINEIPTSPLQVFANKSSSSKSLKIRFPEDTPTSLEIQLTPILMMLPQWIFLKKI